LTRPEFVLLALLLALDVVVFNRPRRALHIAVLAIGMGVVVLPWLVYAHLEFHTILPNALRAELTVHRASALLDVLKYFASFYLFGAAAIAIVALRHRDALRTALDDPSFCVRWFLPVAWLVSLPTYYASGGAPVAGGYMMLGLPAYALIGVKAWEWVVRSATDWTWKRALVTASAAVTIAQLVVVQALYRTNGSIDVALR